jgi:hypothetical protein
LLAMSMLTGCLSSNEDPTNIELEVLRASLLEKQLTIDELRLTIDEYVATTNEHLSEIDQLNKNLDTEISIRKRIASESNKLLRINTDARHYFEIDEDLIFMINNYEDSDNEYSLEKLYLYKNGSLPQLLYSHEHIEFDLNREEKYVIVATTEELAFQDYNATTIQTVPLNLHTENALIQFFEDEYIHMDKPTKSLSIITSIDEGNKILLNGVYTIDYSDLEDIIIVFHEINSSDYFIDEVGATVYYSISDEEQKNILYNYNLDTHEKYQLAVNTNLPFKLYKKDNQVYYYSEAVESEISISLAE